MIKTVWAIGLAGFLTLTIGCGGGETDQAGGSESSGDDLAQQTDLGQTNAAETAPASNPDMDSENDEAPVPEFERPQVERYESVVEEAAVYTLDDIPNQGSYLKIDFNGLSDDQVNRIVHRLRTEYCTCGCPEDTIDECLVNDPSCTTATTLAEQVIREEKAKG